jgi:hypothetical protein
MLITLTRPLVLAKYTPPKALYVQEIPALIYAHMPTLTLIADVTYGLFSTSTNTPQPPKLDVPITKGYETQ